jgi:hypothetical protein
MVAERTNTVLALETRDVRDDELRLGGPDISVAEKPWWSWQMRQSPQPSRVLFAFVLVAGSEKARAPTTVFETARRPCVCAASTVVV